MKEIPIIFSTPMVQAILEGRKTQTRRVIKEGFRPGDKGKNGWILPEPWNKEIVKFYTDACPYGNPGDVLWVRESIYYSTEHDNFYYSADKQGVGNEIYHLLFNFNKRRIIPAGFMPKQACRLFLLVTGIRPERLQGISEEDAIDEGVKDPYEYQDPVYYDQPCFDDLQINQCAFAGLWDCINAKKGYGWENNPWVWRIEFEKQQ